MDQHNLAALIDHTLLKADATQGQILSLCQEAAQYHFASVCVHPVWVNMCAAELNDTPVKVCTVIGFPLGLNQSSVKAYETKQAIQDGATEVDMVLPVSALKDRDDQKVLGDIEAVVMAAQDQAIVKVIIETSLLTNEEKVRACLLSKEAGAHYVKTSTGFSSGGATIEDVRLMRETVGLDMGVKASGGIRDFRTAQDMIEAGANRLGVSAGVAIVQRLL